MSGTLRSGARVARGATYLFVEGIISSVISIAYFIILTRVLEPEEMGVYALLAFILSITVIGHFALPLAATRYIAQYLGERKPEKARSVVARVLQICLLSSAAMSTLFFVFAGLLSKLMWSTPISVFLVLAFTAFFNILLTVANSFLLGLQRIQEVAATRLANTVVQNLVSIYLLLIGWGLLGIVCGWLAGVIVSSLTALILTGRFLGIREKLHPARPLIDFSLPLWISTFLTLVAHWVDPLFVLPYMGRYHLGIYSIALRAYAIPSLISTSLISVLFPKFSQLYAQGGARSLKDAFHTTTRYGALIGLPVVVGLAALAYPLIVGLATEKYVEAVLPLTVLCMAAIPATWGTAIHPTLLTLERTWISFMRTSAFILFNTLICYVTLAYLNLGTLGASSARVIASLISFGIGVYFLRKGLGITFDKEALWKALLASVVMATTVTLSRSVEGFVSQSYLIYLIPFYVMVGAVAYFFSLVALKAIKKQDLEIMHEYLPTGLKRVAVWLGRAAFIE